MSKYYIPKLEDLFVGYECLYSYEGTEVPTEKRYDLWKSKLESSQITDYEMGNVTIQTKYIDEEDLKSEGYNKSLNNDHTLYHKAVQYGGLILDMNYEDSIIKIDFLDHLGSELTVFFGRCPSINELRKIERLVTI